MADSSGENKQDNKGKSSHHSIAPVDSSPPLIDFPPCDLQPSEISQSSNELGSTRVGSDQHRGDPEVNMHAFLNWNDSFAEKIEELLLSNLRAIFQGAIKQIVELGYSEEEAEKALSRRAIYIQEGDPVSNIVNDTLNVLKGKYVATSDIEFKNFQHLLCNTLVEMISLLREVRPSLTVGEAMWSLLMCDLNFALACTAEVFLNIVSIREGSTSASIFQLKSVVQSPDITLNYSSSISKESPPTLKNCKSEAPTFGKLQNSPNNKSSSASERVKPEEETASLPTVSGRPFETLEDVCKGGSCSKRHNIKDIAALRQMLAYEACEKGSLMMDKIIEPLSDIHNQQMKNVSSNTTSKQGVCASDATSDIASTLPAGGSSATLPDAILSSSIVNPNISASDTIPKPKSQPNPYDAHKIPDYCAGIPYDESQGKYVPRDQKDKCILKLIPIVDLLEGKLQGWTNWANQKIMQVTAKLGKLQPELKMLKKEKQEAEKDAILFQENAAKKISEVDNATEKTRKQGESITSDALILEVENSMLDQELDADKLSLEMSMTRHQEALEREQMARKKAESLESENAMHRDDLEREKQKLSKLQQQLDREKTLLTRFEGRAEKERAEKEKLLAEAASITRERKQVAEHTEAEEDRFIKNAAQDLQKYVEAIAKLEKQLAEIKQKSESAKIAALHKGEPMGSKKPSTSKTIVSGHAKSAAGSSRWEQECVMCLSLERSVFFLPCAHQVLCAECNRDHEEQGMKECPTCRVLIQHRIHARFFDQ